MTERRFSHHENSPIQSDVSSGEASVNDVPETLRLLAERPAPSGLEDRVHRRLASQRNVSQQRSIWSLWKPAQRLQFAGVAALMLVIGVSSWTVFRGQAAHQPGTATQPAAPVSPAAGFGTAGAERHPGTIKPIKVPPAPKKKPGASRLAKPAPKAEAEQ